MRLTGIIRDRGCLTEVSNISFHSNRAQYYDAKFGIRRNVFTTFIQMYSALVVLVFFSFFFAFWLVTEKKSLRSIFIGTLITSVVLNLLFPPKSE